MKLPCPRLVLVALLGVVSLHAGTRESAFQAREMLGPDVWSRVIRVERETAGRRDRVPAEYYGLVMAFEGILWFYTEKDGTQNLSLYSGRLAEDQADLAPLLRVIEPGLKRFEDVTDRPPASLPAGPPPRTCFLGSVARWQQLRREPGPPTRARLIAYYYPRAKQNGHMVLEYWREGRRYIFDPDTPATERELPVGLAEDPLKVARALYRPGDWNSPVRASRLELSAPDRPDQA